MSYADRDQLYRSAAEALGREEANTLMASLPPMEWSEIATKTDLRELEARMYLRFETLEHKLTATFESALRKQTQWVAGALGAMALSMLGVVVSVLTLA